MAAQPDSLPQLSVSGRSLTGDPNLAFRMRAGTKEALPELLEKALIEKGWEEHDPKQQGPEGWNVTWQNRRFGPSQHLACKSWQRLNHFPGTLEITHKDGLIRAMRRLQSQDHHKHKLSHFIPESFVLPREYLKLVDVIHKRKQCARERGDDVWIYKPASQSRGRGISLFRDVGEWKGGNGVAVVQHYIKPLLMAGFKFDLRLYVAVVSLKPLVAYVYQDFLVRFATERYNLDDLSNVYSHLTNTSINTLGPGYRETKGYIGTGCKWNMHQLCIRFHQDGIDDRLLWQRVTDIIILTLKSQESSDKSCSSHCVELLGFDILIDQQYRPWLLEVNESPSLANDCAVDEQIKVPMLRDLIDLMKLKESDRIPAHRQVNAPPRQGPRQRLPTTYYPRPSTKWQRVRSRQPTATVRTYLRPTETTVLPIAATLPRANGVCADQTTRRPGCRPVTSSGHRCLEQLPTRHGCHTPEPPDLFVGNFVLIFPFNRATRRDESLSFVLEELQKKNEELRASFVDSPFDWASRPRSYPFAMHQEADWPVFWPGMQQPVV